MRLFVDKISRLQLGGIVASQQPYWQEPVDVTAKPESLTSWQRFALRLGWTCIFALVFATLTVSISTHASIIFICLWLGLEIAGAVWLTRKQSKMYAATLDGSADMQVIVMDEYLLIDAGQKHRFSWWRWLSIQRQLRSHNIEHSFHKGRRIRHIWATHVPRVPEQIRFYTYPSADRLKPSVEDTIGRIIKQAFRMRLPNGITFSFCDNRGHIDSFTEKRRI